MVEVMPAGVPLTLTAITPISSASHALPFARVAGLLTPAVTSAATGREVFSSLSFEQDAIIMAAANVM